jgi:hypothetical protein
LSSSSGGHHFPHVCPSQRKYVSPFNTEDYFAHRIGSGSYSKAFRRPKKSGAVDYELRFSQYRRFNDTVEFRFANATHYGRLRSQEIALKGDTAMSRVSLKEIRLDDASGNSSVVTERSLADE